jgi:HK97 family phage portal protein
MARATMMASWSAETYNARYWQHGGAPTTVLTSEQEVNQTQADDAGELWRSRRAKGPDFPAVLGKGLEARAFGADIAGASAVEARREQTLDIGRLFGVPAQYLDIALAGSSKTYSNLNDEALSLERFTLGQFVDPIQDTISELLPGDAYDDRHMVIDMTTLTRAGQEARYRAWQIATGKPWMLPAEVRTAEGLPPDDNFPADGGDTEVETEVSNSAPGIIPGSDLVPVMAGGGSDA